MHRTPCHFYFYDRLYLPLLFKNSKLTVKLFFCLLIILLGAAEGVVQAADLQKQQQLQREIEQLSSSLNSQQTESDSLQKEMTRLEQKLGDISRQQYQTEKKIDDVMSRLQKANEKKLKLDAELNVQKTGLAQQLQALYTAGEQSHLRLLLRQDEPSDISRTVRYFEYMNASRLKRIKTVNTTVKEIGTLNIGMEQDRLALQELNKSLANQKNELQATLSARSNALQTIKEDMNSKEKRLNQLKEEEAGLQNMIDRIARQSEQAEAKETVTENRKTANEAVPADSKPAKESPKEQKTAKATDKADATISTETVAVRIPPGKPFTALRGLLSWPVQGKIIHSYDSTRNEKQRWRGVVIAANGGTKVKAIARGRVAFAGWVNGYGHLVIIEHDHTYMSLYGYNRAVYKKEGDIVQANETIAAVGNSSGQSQDALYFEIRQGTTPQNPARWCR